MAAPIQMTTQTLNALKGWPRPNAVDFAAPFDPSVNVRVPPGSCVRVNSAGFLALGVGALLVMPLFTIQASDDPDVVNTPPGDPAVTKGVWIGINPTGVVNTLVAIGAYELTSTNYNAAVSYAPNDPLTSPTVTGGGVNAGQLTKGVLKTNTIVGLVSRGVVDNGYGSNAISFWPLLLPTYI